MSPTAVVSVARMAMEGRLHGAVKVTASRVLHAMSFLARPSCPWDNLVRFRLGANRDILVVLAVKP